MPVLSVAARERLAAWITKNVLAETATILGEVRTPGTSGGSTTTYQARLTGIPCAVLPAGSPRELLIAGQEVGFIPKIILLPQGTDVRGSDRIQVGTVTYHVIDIYEPSTYEVARRVL